MRKKRAVGVKALGPHNYISAFSLQIVERIDELKGSSVDTNFGGCEGKIVDEAAVDIHR